MSLIPARIVILPLGLAMIALLAISTLAQAANVLYVTPSLGDDEPLIDIIQSGGHRVVAQGNFDAAPPTSEDLADVDVIVMSRGANSGDYISAPGEAAGWNSLDVPLLQFQMYLARGNMVRWGWFESDTIVGQAFTPTDFDAFPNASHPFVNGLTTSVYPAGQTTDYLDISNGATFPAGATTVATMTYEGNSIPAIVDIPSGTTLFADNEGTVTNLGERRVLFQIHEYVDGTSPSQDLPTFTSNGAAIVNQIISTLGGPGTSMIGDVNNDGFVDTGDYDVILANFGNAGTLSDGDLTGDGLVDLEDFHFWRTAASATAVSAAVPEPAAVLLAVFGIAGLGGVGFKRRRRSA